MSKSTVWLPGSRAAIPAKAAVWIAVCTVKKTVWNILDTALTELTALRITAGSLIDSIALYAVVDGDIRTYPSDTVMIKTVFSK